MNYIKLYLITLPLFLAIDMLWLGGFAKDFYARNLGHLMRPSPEWISAGVFYFLNIVGILIFAVIPALEKRSMSSAVILGALFGLFTYSTYDLTNRATLRDWPLIVVFVDIIWGVFLTGLTSGASFWIATKMDIQ